MKDSKPDNRGHDNLICHWHCLTENPVGDILGEGRAATCLGGAQDVEEALQEADSGGRGHCGAARVGRLRRMVASTQPESFSNLANMASSSTMPTMLDSIAGLNAINHFRLDTVWMLHATLWEVD